MSPILRLEKGEIVLPALATAHSHAFQRALRGKAQRPVGDRDDFWSWREAMYAVSESLTPESLYQISRIAYEELYRAGVRTVGEFHYVHHQPGGSPYDERTLLATAVIEAALDEGLRICLLRVVYHRASAERSAEGPQLRFADPTVETALRDVDDLWTRYAHAPGVRIGVAPHSVRAVPPTWLAAIAEHAERRRFPVHMHVAEQVAEVEQCLAETGHRPVELLAEKGLLSARFTAVHATHLGAGEARLLGEAGASVCLCPTTERDLGDGLPDVGALFDARVTLCTGVDSHVLTAPLEDMRAIELGERLRTGRRVVVRPEGETPAEWLWRVGSHYGARACGFDDAGRTLRIDRGAPELALVERDDLLDAIVFSGHAGMFAPEPRP